MTMQSDHLNLMETLDNPLSCDELQQLDNLLKQRGGLTLFQTHGLLCAILSGPHPLASETWLSAIWGEKQPFDSLEDLKSLINQVMRLHNDIAERLFQEDCFIPLIDYHPLTSFPSHELTQTQRQHLTLWCQGYLQGMALDGECWDAGATEALTCLVLPIILLAQGEQIDVNPRRWLFKRRSAPNELHSLLTTAREALPTVIPAIYDYWCAQEALTQEQVKKKTGRNDPCPCGSGKKYKKCCLINNEDSLH